MASPEVLPQLLTIDELAERHGVSIRHIRRLVAERRVPYLRVGWLVRFDPAEIASLARCFSTFRTAGRPSGGTGHSARSP